MKLKGLKEKGFKECLQLGINPQNDGGGEIPEPDIEEMDVWATRAFEIALELSQKSEETP